MVSVSIRVLTLAAWCVMAASALSASMPAGGFEALTLDASGIVPDHAPQALLAIRHVTPARHGVIRHSRTGSRQLPSLRFSVVVTGRTHDQASRTSAQRVHVPARHLLLNLIAPRPPTTFVL